MLLVIFGAGASYDSIPHLPPHPRRENHEFRPPLANDLFGDRQVFRHPIERLPRLQPIVPRLRHLNDENLETVLEEIQAEAGNNEARRRQLMAVRYYLHYMIAECVRRWRDGSSGVDNYKSFLDEIEQFRNPEELVCLVTFNYDTMLDEALASVGFRIKQMEDYMSGHKYYRLLKPHGSVNWAHPVEGEEPSAVDSWVLARNHIERASELAISAEFVKIGDHAGDYPCRQHAGRSLVPAIAIPVQSKNRFECPTEHLNAFGAILSETDKVILIGWRATESHFLALLGQRLVRQISGLVVAGSKKEEMEIAQRFERFLFNAHVEWECLSMGFTDLITQKGARRILQNQSYIPGQSLG